VRYFGLIINEVCCSSGSIVLISEIQGTDIIDIWSNRSCGICARLRKPEAVFSMVYLRSATRPFVFRHQLIFPQIPFDLIRRSIDSCRHWRCPNAW